MCKAGMAVTVCVPNIGEAGAGGLPWVQSSPGLNSEFQASLEYRIGLRVFLKIRYAFF